jgi:hypothetical protein
MLQEDAQSSTVRQARGNFDIRKSPRLYRSGGIFINRERDETQGQLGLKEPNCLLSNEISLAEGF